MQPRKQGQPHKGWKRAAKAAQIQMPRELDFLELAHWIAAPMNDVGTIEQFHSVVERAEELLSIAARNGHSGLEIWMASELTNGKSDNAT